MAQMNKKFQSMDVNKDGTLDVHELKQMLTKGAKGMSGDAVQTLYDSVDANKDGKVT